MATISVTPQTVAKTTPITLTFVGTGTTWATTPPTITPSAGSLGAPSVASNTLCTATFTPPGTPQLVTFTDTTDGSITTVTTVVTQSISIVPAVFNKSTATPYVINGVGTVWVNAPTITASAGTITGAATANQTQAMGTFTPSAATGSVTFTDTTDGSITCTATVVQSLAVSPVVCPTSASVQLLFTSFTAGWTSGSLPTITASVGTLGAINFLSSSLVWATYTAPATPQAVTFTDTTDGSITATLQVVTTNVYTYTLQDMLNAGVFYGRWSNLFKGSPASSLLFSFSAPYSSVLANGLSATFALFYASGSGNLSAPATVQCASYGAPTVCPLFSSTTEAQYNIAVGSINTGTGWSTALASASTKIALTIYSTAATKPTLTPYVDNFQGSGTLVTMPSPPAPFQADGSMAMLGNSAVSPPILSGNFAPYGFTDFYGGGPFGGVAPEVTPPIGFATLPNVASAGIFPKARFRATTPAIYIHMSGNNPITAPAASSLVPWHLEMDGKPYLDLIPSTPLASSASCLQWLPLAVGLDGAAEHEYSIYGGFGTAALDKIMLPGGAFALKPPLRRPAGAVIGDSHTQAGICWEAYGSQAGSYAHYISRRNGGMDMVNLGISGDKVLGLNRIGKALAVMPVLANGVVGAGAVPASFTATVSGGAVTAITTVTGGSGYPGTSIELVILSSEGGIGAYAVASIVGGVIQASPVIQAGGSGYTLAPAVFAPTGTGVLGKGVPDFLIDNMGFNDQGFTARATARGQIMLGLGQWLTTCPGPLICSYPYSSGNPYVAPLSGSYLTLYSNYDKTMVLNQIAIQRPDYYARIIIADLTQISISGIGSQCGGNTGSGLAIPTPGWNHGGHFSCFTYDQIALTYQPAVSLVLGQIRRYLDA
jgi:hypothetical protein